jgi:hypothetical protein
MSEVGCDVKEVESLDGDYKYILAEVALERKGRALRSIVVSTTADFHRDILDKARADHPGMHVRAVGGGILKIDLARRRVLTFGRSGSYGVANMDVVGQCIATRFPPEERWQLDLRSGSYIRGENSLHIGEGLPADFFY